MTGEARWGAGIVPSYDAIAEDARRRADFTSARRRGGLGGRPEPPMSSRSA
jgi:hypothetical protein